MLGLEQMVSTHFRNWEPGPGRATSLEEASFCFPQGECGKPSLSCASQSSFPCRALGLQGKAVFLYGLSGKQKGSRRQSSLHLEGLSLARSQIRSMAQTHHHKLTHLAGGNLRGLSPSALGPAVFLTQ